MPDHFHELKDARNAWNAICSGDVNGLWHSNLNADDIKKLEELVGLLKFAGTKEYHFPVVSKAEADKLLVLAKHFGIAAREEPDRVSVLDEDDTGYEARPDWLLWYIRESFTCNACGVQTEPFKRECKKHFDYRKKEDVGFLKAELQNEMFEFTSHMDKVTLKDVQKIAADAEKFIRARDEKW
jgi:hypothetical protein